MSHVLSNISRGRFFEPIFTSKKLDLFTSIYGKCSSHERLNVFHKNDYSDEFIDTNYYKQNKQNDDFELYVTKDRFYNAYSTFPTKTPTDFDKYMTAG